MILRSWLFAIAASMSASHAPVLAATKAPLSLKPATPWHLDYAADSCRMMRIFGEVDQRIVLLMERFGPGDYFSLVVVGKPVAALRLLDGRPVKVGVRFGPVEGEQELTVMPASLTKLSGFMVSGISFAAIPEELYDGPRRITIEAGRESTVTTLAISRLARNDVILELESMAKPMAAMRKCTDELLTHWGIDVAQHAKRLKDAVPTENPGNWMRSGDYPRQMLIHGQQGLVNFRLMVGPDGKPTSCHIQRSTRPQEFDDAVCRGLMRRASFTPAIGADGKAIVSYFQSSVRFQISA